MRIKISKAAEIMNVHKITVLNYIKSGKLPGTQSKTGMWYVEESDVEKFLNGEDSTDEKGVAIYARVSSSQNKKNLETQEDRLKQFCLAKGWKVSRSIKEVGSGMNDKRPQFLSLIKNYSDYDKIVVEHKDRLTRFGFDIITTFVPNVYVINETNDEKENLVEDLVSIITSYCSKIYGQRKSKRKTESLIKELKED